MEFIIYLVPFLVSIILCIFFKKHIVWWEYIVLIIPSILLILFMKFVFVEIKTADVQYLGTYVTKTTYYEPWNEKVIVQRTRQVPCGTTSKGVTKFCTEVYYTTEIRWHSAEYTYQTSLNNREHTITKDLYNKINQKLQTKPIFKDLKRKYHTLDGDAYVTIFDGKIKHMYDITFISKYQNKIKASTSNTIFKLEDIDDKKAQKFKLYDYPKVRNEQQTPILGKKLSEKDEQIIRYINAIKGPSKQFRMYILFFKENEFDKSELQKSYWQNGNKNEFVVCLGMKGDTVKWVNPFSWSDKPNLEVRTKTYFIQNPKLDIYQYGVWLNKEIDTQWERKNFDDFDYIDIELTIGNYIFILIFVLLFNIGVSIILINNDIKNE